MLIRSQNSTFWTLDAYFSIFSYEAFWSLSVNNLVIVHSFMSCLVVETCYQLNRPVTATIHDDSKRNPYQFLSKTDPQNIFSGCKYVLVVVDVGCVQALSNIRARSQVLSGTRSKIDEIESP